MKLRNTKLHGRNWSLLLLLHSEVGSVLWTDKTQAGALHLSSKVFLKVTIIYGYKF